VLGLVCGSAVVRQPFDEPVGEALLRVVSYRNHPGGNLMPYFNIVFSLRRLAWLAAGLIIGAVLIAHFKPAAQAASTFPAGFVSEVVIGSGLNLPTAIAFAPGNRIYIAEKRGVVRVWQNGQLLPTPFINLEDEVQTYGDRGLLGLAVHPNFPAAPYLYLLYSYDPPGVEKDELGARVSRLLRVTADAANLNVASTAEGSRVVLMGMM
jgi:glucose/arabinose dehydrogenase